MSAWTRESKEVKVKQLICVKSVKDVKTAVQFWNASELSVSAGDAGLMVLYLCFYNTAVAAW